MAVQIAVVAEHRLGDGSAQGRIDPRHEHGLLAERLEHPLAEACLAVFVAVPDADTQREGYAVVAAAEDGTVGGSGQRRLDLFLRGSKVGAVRRFTVIGNLLQAGKELVVIGNVLRHGTRDEEQHAEQVYAISFHR